jgi:hypothetical protein
MKFCLFCYSLNLFNASSVVTSTQALIKEGLLYSEWVVLHACIRILTFCVASFEVIFLRLGSFYHTSVIPMVP